MDRAAEIRAALARALNELDGERRALDLVEEIPLLERIVEDLASARIAGARASGASWAAIAERLGVSRQAAHKRFGGDTSRRGTARFELRVERGRRRAKS